MTKMLATFKTEIYADDKQAFKLDSAIGASRWAYNLFLDINKQRYEDDYRYLSANQFSKWFNHNWIKYNPGDNWVTDESSKNIKQAFIDADKSMKRFWKHESSFPHWRALKHQEGSFYFVRNSKKQPIKCERNRIKLPTIGWVVLKEEGYIPYGKKSVNIKSGRVKRDGNHFFVTCVAEMNQPDVYQVNQPASASGLGIDIGIKDAAIMSYKINGKIFYKNLNKSRRLKRLYKHIHRVQRHLSRQFTSYRARKKVLKDNPRQDYPTDFNLFKTETLLRNLYRRVTNILNDYQNKIVASVVKVKPAYVVIEDLNVSGMLKNHHLAKAIKRERFYSFRQKMIWVCQRYGIPVHLVNRFYPSSKRCSRCGHIMSNLKLSDRVYHCPVCGLVIDRDLNAAINLSCTRHYTLLDSCNNYTISKRKKSA